MPGTMAGVPPPIAPKQAVGSQGMLVSGMRPAGGPGPGNAVTAPWPRGKTQMPSGGQQMSGPAQIAGAQTPAAPGHASTVMSRLARSASDMPGVQPRATPGATPPQTATPVAGGNR